MMRYVTFVLLLAVLILSACQPIVAQPEDAPPTAAVNFYTSHGAHERFGKIDLASGVGVDVGPYANPEVGITRTEWAAANGAVYEDAFYVILNRRLPSGAASDEAEARLARVDMQTGEVELLGSVIPLNLMALEIDHCGEMFAAGFTLSNQLGEWFGDTNLYRVDRQDGTLTLIGDTGIERIMDLSFDPEGTLWATVGNVLYTLDMETGSPTEMAMITGVEEDNEIMGIGFTSEGELNGTTPWSDGFYLIDPASGVATEVGRHGFTVPHGGDIPMTPHDLRCDTVETALAEDQVRAASAAWDEAFNAADLDRLMSLYAEDAVDMPPGFPASEGKATIAADLEYIFGEFDAQHETSILDIVISGDLALERANYTMELTPKAGGETINEVGKHVVVRQKVGDEWKVLWEIWNWDSAE